MGCGITTVKYLLFIFNLVFALCGLALVIAGALCYANIDKADYFMERVKNEANFSASPIALIVVGAIVFVVAFFGCCGAIRESHCMIITFAVFLLVILIVQIAIGIAAFVTIYGEGWEQAVKDTISNTFGNYTLGESNALNNEVDNLQRNLECCGVDHPTYWRDVRGFAEIPRSCCINPDPNAQCTSFRPEDQQVFQDGCVERLKELLRNIGIVLGAIAIAVGLIEITGVVFALCLASSIKNKERRGTA